LPQDVTDAQNSILGVCPSVRPSLRWSLTLSKLWMSKRSLRWRFM